MLHLRQFIIARAQSYDVKLIPVNPVLLSEFFLGFKSDLPKYMLELFQEINSVPPEDLALGGMVKFAIMNIDEYVWLKTAIRQITLNNLITEPE